MHCWNSIFIIDTCMWKWNYTPWLEKSHKESILSIRILWSSQNFEQEILTSQITIKSYTSNFQKQFINSSCYRLSRSSTHRLRSSIGETIRKQCKSTRASHSSARHIFSRMSRMIQRNSMYYSCARNPENRFDRSENRFHGFRWPDSAIWFPRARGCACAVCVHTIVNHASYSLFTERNSMLILRDEKEKGG